MVIAIAKSYQIIKSCIDSDSMLRDRRDHALPVHPVAASSSGSVDSLDSDSPTLATARP